MELKKIIKIIKKDIYLFSIVWLAVIFLAIGLVVFESEKFNITLPILISRDSAETSPEYKYDQYYKMMADEKFGNTLKEILNSNNFLFQLNAALEDKKINHQIISLKANNLAPSFVEVEIKTKNKKDAALIMENLKQLLNKKIDNLKAEEDETSWFQLQYQKYTISGAGLNRMIVFGAGFIFGFFIAFFVIIFRYYWKD